MSNSNDIEENPFLQASNDSLTLRETGAWAAEKLDYLGRYLDIFMNSMCSKPWRGIQYIDLFSGPGKCQIRNTGQILIGSPLIALQLKYPFSQYYYADMDEQAIETLKTRCNNSPYRDRIQYFTGDSNLIVQEIVCEITKLDSQIIENKWRSSLNLAFLDPEGLELEWRTVKALGNVRRMDMIIYYPQMGLTRQIPNEIDLAPPTRIDRFFGCTTWRDIYRQARKTELHRELLDLYKSNLKKLGYMDYKDFELFDSEPVMRSKEKNAPLYRLLFASKHPLGNKFWKKVTRRNIYGQTKLL